MDQKEKMTVIGIIPQYAKNSQNNVYANIKMPPVGLISILSQDYFSGFNVYAIDENNYKGPVDLRGMPDHNFLQKREPAKIAMFYGGMSNSIPRMYYLAKQYKNFGALTIAGGSHVDALPREALISGIDIVVHGEGEETIQELLKTIVENGKIRVDKEKLNSIKGISFLDNEEYIFTGKREPIKDLSLLNNPDLTLIKFLEKKMTTIPISKGRGCHYNCEFCAVNKQYGRFKSGSNEKVLEQIIKYSNLGHNSFFITDDNFAQNVPETIELCKMIGDYKKKFKKKIELIVQVRSEIANNDKLIHSMVYAGVKTICIGFESPINEELKAMNKGITSERLIQNSRKLSKYFDYILGMLIFGYPTFEDSKYKSTLTLDQKAKEYWRFIKKSKISIVQILTATPIPGTKLREKLENEKRILPIGWEYYDGLHLCYKPEKGVDGYDLQNIPRTLMKKWYRGNFINSALNSLNWANWTYYTFAFPIQFPIFYTKRFVHNLIERKREKGITEEKETLLPKRNIIYAPFVYAWGDIKKKWGSLAVKTYARGIVRRWYKEYEKSEYLVKFKNYFQKKNN